MLVIVPKDSDAILARQNWIKKRLLRMNLRLGYPLINIPQVILPVTVDQLAVWIYQRLNAVANDDTESAHRKPDALDNQVVRLRGNEQIVIRDHYE